MLILRDVNVTCGIKPRIDCRGSSLLLNVWPNLRLCSNPREEKDANKYDILTIAGYLSLVIRGVSRCRARHLAMSGCRARHLTN